MAFTDRLPQAWKQIKKNMTDIAGKLGKTEKAVDSDKLDGNDSTYFAKQSDIITKLDKGSFTGKADELMPKSGGVFTGRVEISDGRLFVGSNNYGFACKDTSGAHQYVALVAPNNKIYYGWNKACDIVLSGKRITNAENKSVIFGDFTKNNNNFYIKYADGMIIQGGFHRYDKTQDCGDGDYLGQIALPVAMSTNTYGVCATILSGGKTPILKQLLPSTTFINPYVGGIYNDSANTAYGIRWIAIGY